MSKLNQMLQDESITDDEKISFIFKRMLEEVLISLLTLQQKEYQQKQMRKEELEIVTKQLISQREQSR